MKYKIEYSEKLYDSNYSNVINLLNNYYLHELSETNENIRRGFGVYAKDENSNLIGGLVGYSELNWMYLDSMYVYEQFRKQGIAKKFMELAQKESIERNCIGIKLEAYQNTVEFYKKEGYLTYYVENDSLEHEIFYMKKILIKNG